MGYKCKKACSLSRLFEFGRCQRITRHFVARPAGRCWRNVLSLRSSRTSLPPEVLILMGYKCKKACSLSRLFEFGRCQRITRHFVARPAGRCWRNVLSLRSSRTSLPPEVLILMGYKCKKACSLSRLFEFGRCQRITRHFVARPAGRCWRNVLSLRSSRTSLPPEVLILMGYKCKKACSLSRLFEFGR